MDKEEFKSDLTSQSLSLVSSKWVMERIPFLFGADSSAHIAWKENLAHGLNVDSRSMLITGSAGCGFSLSPHKDYRNFDSESDIDIALVSLLHFDLAWHTLRNLGTKIYGLTPLEQSHVKEHVGKLIYWGTIATDKILPLLPYGRTWIPVLSAASATEVAGGRDVKVRVYRDFESLRQYQIQGFKKLKNKLIV